MPGRGRASVFASVACVVIALAAPQHARAHAERPSTFPSGDGSVPRYRDGGPTLVVCTPGSDEAIRDLPRSARRFNRSIADRCAFRNIQAAVDAVERRGTRILVMPGVYRERPSLATPKGACADLLQKTDPYTYEEQVACPHNQNLIAITGDGPDEGIACDGRLCDLQIEGTGDDPLDVVVDVGFHRLNGIRGDRADGLYLSNFTVQETEFNAVYILETDGFAIDRMLGRWNLEYGFLTFSSDHGLYQDCEAYGNGDSGVYPGSAADLHGARHAIEIRRCFSHHNALGYSGTAGNSVWAHDNVFTHNATGVSMDSFFPDHPGLPQDSAVFTDNVIAHNNENYFDNLGAGGPCDKPLPEIDWEGGVVCPVVPLPVGTGIILAGGNANTFARNRIFNNHRYGTMQFWVPAPLRDEMDPTLLYDTSHFNRYVGNRMGVARDGTLAPNGTDFWWDEEGSGNCWAENRGGSDGLTSDPATLPTCNAAALFLPGNPLKQAMLIPCSQFEWRENPHPTGCDWMTSPPPP